MSEDNKHIEIFKEEVKKEQSEYANVNEYTKFFYNNHKIILNIINKLQKEIEEQDEIIEKSVEEQKEREKYTHQLEKELDKKDKVINLIINMILSYDIDEDICRQIGKLNCDKYKDGECGKCLKEYFYKKVEEENE